MTVLETDTFKAQSFCTTFKASGLTTNVLLLAVVTGAMQLPPRNVVLGLFLCPWP